MDESGLGGGHRRACLRGSAASSTHTIPGPHTQKKIGRSTSVFLWFLRRFPTLDREYTELYEYIMVCFELCLILEEWFENGGVCLGVYGTTGALSYIGWFFALLCVPRNVHMIVHVLAAPCFSSV